MHHWAKTSTAFVAACLMTASNASAQSANINVTATVFQAITVSGFRALDFGNVFPGVNKIVAPDAATSGRFDATGQTGANVNMTFTLPTNLVNGVNNLPIGPWTGCWDTDNNPAAGCSAFVPSAGATAATFSAGGALFVFVGGTVAPAANQAAGAYTATVTLTLAYF